MLPTRGDALGARHLHLVSVDLAPDPHGCAQVTALHTQVFHGLAALQGEAGFTARAPSLEALQSPYTGWAACPPGLAHTGPYNPAYAQHALLAQELDIDLVQGRDRWCATSTCCRRRCRLGTGPYPAERTG